MALVIADRVRETTTVVGTGTATLLGAVLGYQSFTAIGNANTTYYCIAGQGNSEWEVGLGTYTAAGTTLARTTVLASSNVGALVNFSAGTKDVFVTYPAEKSVNLDASGLLTAPSGLGAGVPTALNTAIGTAGSFVVNGGVLGTPSSGTVTNLTGTASININGTVGATTANTGAFTTLTATSGVINANTTLDALRITQIGTGNALVVEDAANPDSTPFVIDTNGRVLSGLTSPYVSLYGNTPSVQIVSQHGVSALAIGRFGNNIFGSDIDFTKTRNASPNLHTIVASGDALGSLVWAGSDGASFIPAASIFSQVDGTPGLNDMPGRLVFSTTADGASTPTERVRINAAGNVGIGNGVSQNDSGLTVNPALTTSNGYYIRTFASVPSTMTGTSIAFSSQLGTAAATFNVPNFIHFSAQQGTFGVGSTVTNQYGYLAESSLIGATNNYGFFSNVPSGTGRWNFYANGTANNYFAGNVGINTNAPTDKLQINAQDGIRAGASGSTSYVRIGSALTGESTAELSFDRSVGATIFNSGNTGSTLTERMRINAAGNVGIGTSAPVSKLSVSTASATAYGLISQTPIVGLTAGDYVNMAYITNARGASNDGLRIVNVRDTTGANTNDWPTESYRIRRSVDQNVGAVGVQEEIVFGNILLAFNTNNTERMRIDSAGNVGIGTTSPNLYGNFAVAGSGAVIQGIVGDTTGEGQIQFSSVTAGRLAVTGAFPLIFQTNATERMRLDASGNLGIGTTSPTARLDIASIPTVSTPVLRLFGNNGGGTIQNLSGLQYYWNLSSGGAESTLVYGNLTTSYLVFGKHNGTSYSEQMRLDASGNLGIGTTAPSGKLDVKVGASNGNISFGRSVTELEIFVSNGNDQYLGSTVAGSVGVRSNTGSALFLGTQSTQSLVLETNSVARATLDSVGNLQVQTGAVVVYAPAPASISAAATLTNANILAQIINTTGTTYTLTLPLAATLETLITWSAVNIGYDFTVINTASGIVYLAANGNTTLGSLTIGTNISATFRIRRTAANAFTIYRLD